MLIIGDFTLMLDNGPKREYPSEHIVPLVGNEFLLGRLTLNLAHDGLTVEIDIVQKESRKIFRNVARLYKIEDHDEALHLGIQKLSEFLNGKNS